MRKAGSGGRAEATAGMDERSGGHGGRNKAHLLLGEGWEEEIREAGRMGDDFRFIEHASEKRER